MNNYFIGPEHNIGYSRRDLLRIPQDMLHRFSSSVGHPPVTIRTRQKIAMRTQYVNLL